MIWLLFLSAIVASVLGHDHASKDHEPLRYNPNDHVYNYDKHDRRLNDILNEFNSPDYHQPTLVLDYRYMRTGGREYVQGPGGQYIILPHNVRSPQKNKFRNFDELLDYVQQRQHNRGNIYRENYDKDDHQEQPRYDDQRQRHHSAH